MRKQKSKSGKCNLNWVKRSLRSWLSKTEIKRKTQRRISNCVALKTYIVRQNRTKLRSGCQDPKLGQKTAIFEGGYRNAVKTRAKLSFCRVFYVYGYALSKLSISGFLPKYGFKHKVFVVVMIDGLYRHSHRLAMYVYIVRRFRAMPQFTPSALSVFWISVLGPSQKPPNAGCFG